MYVLKEGEMTVRVRDEDQKESYVNLLGPCSLFGEVALISNCKRTATVQCMNYSFCAQLPAVHFREMIRLFPELYNKLKEVRREYNDKWKSFLRKIL